jgi:hypothetical protein
MTARPGAARTPPRPIIGGFAGAALVAFARPRSNCWLEAGNAVIATASRTPIKAMNLFVMEVPCRIDGRRPRIDRLAALRQFRQFDGRCLENDRSNRPGSTIWFDTALAAAVRLS